MKPYTNEKILEIKKAIDCALADGAEPVAAFDADGTLWNMDMGEHFFDYQVQKKLLPGLPADPWTTYRNMHDKDAPAAFLWLAQINKGLPLEQIRTWSKQAFREIQDVPVFAGVQEIIQYLQKLNVEIYIVTASIKWAVEPGADFLGIPSKNVIGVSTKVAGGIISDTLDGVVTWREGKVAGLLNSTNRRAPFFAAGNTMGDLALLDLATHVRLANCAAPVGHVNFETEQKLVEISKMRGWFYHHS